MASLGKQQIQDIYREMGIDSNNLGCIMLNTEPIKVSDVIDPDDLYYSDDEQGGKYTQGIVSEVVPHCTLLFGLMESGQTWKKYVDAVLDGWSINALGIESVGFFEGTDPNNSYYCLVAHVFADNNLVEGHTRLIKLPHCDSFATYSPHITLAYIKHDPAKRDAYIDALNARIGLQRIKVLNINYGD